MIYRSAITLKNQEGAKLCELLGQSLANGEIRYFAGYQVVVLQFQKETLSLIFREDLLDLYWEIPEGCVSEPYEYTSKEEVAKYAGCLEPVIGEKLTQVLVTEYESQSRRHPQGWQIGSVVFSFGPKEVSVEDMGDETGIKCPSEGIEGERAVPICA